MILTIDTDRPLSPADRRILAAMLDDGTRETRHTTSSTAAGIWERVQEAPAARRPSGAAASAKLPISRQPGVTATESTADHQETGDTPSYDAENRATRQG